MPGSKSNRALGEGAAADHGAPRFSKAQTVSSARLVFARTLKAIGISTSEAAAEARLALATILKVKEGSLVIEADRLLGESAAVLERVLNDRLKRRPLQYALGQADFFGLTFAVGEGVLIPRPETELIVEAVLAKLEETGPRLIIEVGGGSGCIFVSLLKHFTGARALVFEVSAEAVQYCLKNAAQHQVEGRSRVLQQDFFAPETGAILRESMAIEPVSGKPWPISPIFVSNPPYIPARIMDSLEPEVRDFEPRAALCGMDEDGLGFYRGFAGVLAEFCPGGLDFFLEVGEGQADAVAEIFAGHGFGDIDIKVDLAGIKRIVSGRLN
ncbi:MAG: peptide chain release factor N(5)-glutamine methyltransferase [Candidatus Melainabacteria bacterium]|nr:peptide chain release factor N(5)-glutamine methyltransferase [Candidatus Melainabacteria bacterium]